jgi:uncharacterized membrane protein
VDKGRLEAFSDAVIAIIMTIMVLELKVPDETDWGALERLIPVFLTYVLSFVYLGIYWNNHHHLIKAAGSISSGVLWANLNLLFWLSLFPFATGWMGENHFETLPTVFYGVVLLLAAFAYYALQTIIVAAQPPESPMRRALGRDIKGKISPALYVVGIAVSFVSSWVAVSIYAAVALIWLVPDRRLVPLIDAPSAES